MGVIKGEMEVKEVMKEGKEAKINELVGAKWNRKDDWGKLERI